MCLGIPMQVERVEEGFAWVREDASAELMRVETALIASPQVGDWLLTFLSSAREHLTAERAQEIKQTQALVAQAMSGAQQVDHAVDFVLPSQMDAQALHELLGLKK